jgi:Fe-S cluster biogenesis protein NfuA
MKNIESKIKKALGRIKPSLRADGGDMEFVGFDPKKGILKIKLTGRCAYCPMAQITLKQGIEAEIKKEIKEIKKVEAI